MIKLVLLSCVLIATAPSLAYANAADYIKIVKGASGGCDAFKYNARAENTHSSKAIRATFRWKNPDGGDRSSTWDLEPGQIETITYCNFGALKLQGARYLK